MSRVLYSHVGLSDFNGHVWNADGAPPRPALLYEYPPMDLQGATTDKKYWEKVTQIAAWDPARCQDSLAKTTTYAAGANVAWIQAFALGSPIPAATLPWCQLCDLADKFFQEDSDRSYVLIDGRILFPFTLEAFTELAVRPLRLVRPLRPCRTGRCSSWVGTPWSKLGGSAWPEPWWHRTMARWPRCGMAACLFRSGSMSRWTRARACCRTPSATSRRSACTTRRWVTTSSHSPTSLRRPACVWMARVWHGSRTHGHV